MESLEIENLCWKDKTQKVPGLHDNSNDRQKRMLVYQNIYNAYKLQKHILYNNIVQTYTYRIYYEQSEFLYTT